MNCLTITKKIVTNEMHQPIAVQIDYQDWLKIEQLLISQSVLPEQEKNLADTSCQNHVNGKQIANIMTQIAKRGTAFQNIDPIAWQREVREDRPLLAEDL